METLFDKKTNQFVNNLVKKPEEFLTPSPKLVEDLTQFTKKLFDFTVQNEKQQMGHLDELVVEGFDVDTIWEEIKQHNEPLQSHLGLIIPKVISIVDGDEEEESQDGEQDDEEDLEGDEMDGDEDHEDEEDDGIEEPDYLKKLQQEEEEIGNDVEEDDEDEEDEEDEQIENRLARKQKESKRSKPKSKKDIANDDEEFFSIEAMEKFADEGEEEYLREQESKKNGEVTT
eukprot:TRINITY_DN1865_c0_g1_i4.p1 TRINITY_DN1865_c0_g1~~TRINITY_DN1865_c0_g1_i4.p1  ORF type:complete len:229 (+),score=89.47 TRINITY_DN1865_c0_g1_i4:98-784(+)